MGAGGTRQPALTRVRKTSRNPNIFFGPNCRLKGCTLITEPRGARGAWLWHTRSGRHAPACPQEAFPSRPPQGGLLSLSPVPVTTAGLNHPSSGSERGLKARQALPEARDCTSPSTVEAKPPGQGRVGRLRKTHSQPGPHRRDRRDHGPDRVTNQRRAWRWPSPVTQTHGACGLRGVPSTPWQKRLFPQALSVFSSFGVPENQREVPGTQ